MWHKSKSIWVTRLFFCQNDSKMGGSFWERTAWSLINYWNMPIIIFNPFANFGKQSILQILSHILYVFTLYKWYSLTSFYFFRSTPQSLFLDLSSLALPSSIEPKCLSISTSIWRSITIKVRTNGQNLSILTNMTPN